MSDGSSTLIATCKKCETRYRVPATYEGRKITCRRCGAPIFLRTRSGTGRRPTVRRYTRSRAAVPRKATPFQIASGVISLMIVVAIVVYFILHG